MFIRGEIIMRIEYQCQSIPTDNLLIHTEPESNLISFTPNSDDNASLTINLSDAQISDLAYKLKEYLINKLLDGE